MVAGTLYTYPKSFRGTKSRVAAEFSGATLKVVEVKENDKVHYHVPSFETEDKKFRLFEANSIAYYLSNEQLIGKTAEDKASVVQWLEYGSVEIESSVASWVYAVLGLVESSQQLVNKAKEDLKTVFHCLNEHLKTRTYLVGERITLADISVASELILAYEHVADEQFRAPYVNLNRWFQTMVNQPQFKKVTGEIKLVAKAAEFNAQKYKNYKEHSEKKVAEKPAKAEKPKAEPKPAAAKKPADDDAEEEDEFQEPSSKDPFAEMPKGTFIMDEFKRVYSNEDTATKAIPYFWSHFDKACYSIWFCEYKYCDELALTFMSSNLVGGMFQRIEKLRKNAFASMNVWGENNSNIISGVWIWKGQELAFPLCPDWTTDYESYEWRKMDPDNEADKKLVNQFFLWEGEYKGKKHADGKIFK